MSWMSGYRSSLLSPYVYNKRWTINQLPNHMDSPVEYLLVSPVEVIEVGRGVPLEVDPGKGGLVITKLPTLDVVMEISVIVVVAFCWKGVSQQQRMNGQDLYLSFN